MRHRILTLLFALTLGTALADEPMQRTGDTYVIRTTTLCPQRGYKSTTPVELHIQHGRIVDIKALPNRESKGYFNPMVRRLFPLYQGLKVSRARRLAESTDVDAITGATYSGLAVQANIRAALEYYDGHKNSRADSSRKRDK